MYIRTAQRQDQQSHQVNHQAMLSIIQSDLGGGPAQGQESDAVILMGPSSCSNYHLVSATSESAPLNARVRAIQHLAGLKHNKRKNRKRGSVGYWLFYYTRDQITPLYSTHCISGKSMNTAHL